MVLSENRLPLFGTMLGFEAIDPEGAAGGGDGGGGAEAFEQAIILPAGYKDSAALPAPI